MISPSKDGMFPSMTFKSTQGQESQRAQHEANEKNQDPKLKSEREDEGQVSGTREWGWSEERSANDFQGNAHVNMGQVMLQNEEGTYGHVRLLIHQLGHSPIVSLHRVVLKDLTSPFCRFICPIQLIHKVHLLGKD